MSVWRNIENAPKDGTTVIVGRDMGEPWGFVIGYGFFAADYVVRGWVCTGFTDPPGELGLGNPTHWMPLPDPPEAA